MNARQLADEPTFTRFILACRLPREDVFCRFVAHADGRLDVKSVSIQHATNYIHNVCNIESRTELKHSGEAARRFDYLVRAYRRWADKQCQPA